MVKLRLIIKLRRESQKQGPLRLTLSGRADIDASCSFWSLEHCIHQLSFYFISQ